MAEARRTLPRLLDDVQSGREVRITRRGEPVAVVVSLARYEELERGGQGSWASLVGALRAEFPKRDPESRTWEGLRDRSPGRKQRW